MSDAGSCLKPAAEVQEVIVVSIQPP